MDFGKALDPIVGDAIAQMLGGIPVKAPLSQNALLPPVADCVEVGDTRIIGGVRPQNFDMAYRPDGVRIAYDSKTLNDAKSIKKNWQNMINDIAAEATTLHTRFRYALALFLVVIPEQALNDSQAEGIIHTLERMNERFGVDEENHKAESIALVVWDAVTGRISNTRILCNDHCTVLIYMNGHGIVFCDCLCLFSLFYLLIYFVGNGKIVRSRLFYIPDQHICNSSTGWYVRSDGIGVQVL